MMCFKKKIINWEHSQKVALLFGKNNYPGANALNFCVADINLAKNKIADYGFQVRYFADSNANRKNFREQLTYAFTNAIAGDVIYIKYSGHGSYIKDISGDEIDGFDETLYMDGHFSDDETAELTKLIPEGVTVIFSLDCCYSGTGTRDMSRSRFYAPKEQYPIRRYIKRRDKSTMNHIVMSGCKENETSEEGIINGQGNGIFTYTEMMTLRPDLTYRKWYEQIRICLPSKRFEQTPLIEGPDYLLDRLVFQ